MGDFRIFVESIEKLMEMLRVRGGWIGPDGTPYPASPLSHHTVLEQLPDFADLLPQGDGSKADAWDKMTKRAYDQGFVRVVINSGNVYAEGKQRAVSRCRSDLKDLAAMLGEDAQVVPTYRR